MAKQRSLGKGLGALIPGNSSYPAIETGSGEAGKETVYNLPIDLIQPNPTQPRKDIKEEGIEALASSIREHGIVQPLVVRKKDDDSGLYQIVAGERRWRAARLAELDEIPVRVFTGSDSEVMEVSLIENIQREDLTPLEVAEAIKQLIEHFSLTQEMVGKRLGWSRTAIANKLRLLNLPSPVKEMLNSSSLSEGHARTLLSLTEDELRVEFARQCVKNVWSVRQLEEKIRLYQSRSNSNDYEIDYDPYVIPPSIRSISRATGIKVKVSGKPGQRKVSLNGLTEEQVDNMFRLLESNTEQLFPGK